MRFAKFNLTVPREEYFLEKHVKIPFSRKIDDFKSNTYRYINCLCSLEKYDYWFNNHETALEIPNVSVEKFKVAEIQKVYHVFSDGSSRNNGGKRKGEPQAGCWASLVCKEVEHGKLETMWESSGFLPGATNNQAELAGLLRGLEQVFKLRDKAKKTVIACSDSQYVMKGANNWIYRWMRNGFLNNLGEEVANAGMWREYVSIMTGPGAGHVVRFQWVKGHNALCSSPQSELNKRVDFLATRLMEKNS